MIIKERAGNRYIIREDNVDTSLAKILRLHMVVRQDFPFVSTHHIEIKIYTGSRRRKQLGIEFDLTPYLESIPISQAIRGTYTEIDQVELSS